MLGIRVVRILGFLRIRQDRQSVKEFAPWKQMGSKPQGLVLSLEFDNELLGVLLGDRQSAYGDPLKGDNSRESRRVKVGGQTESLFDPSK